ncbi:MAG: hypothetical protein AB7G75_36560, partial [Candidatus Binatia bacterium]
GVAFQSSSLMPSGSEMFAMLGSLPITNPQPPQPLAPPLCGYLGTTDQRGSEGSQSCAGAAGCKGISVRMYEQGWSDPIKQTAEKFHSFSEKCRNSQQLGGVGMGKGSVCAIVFGGMLFFYAQPSFAQMKRLGDECTSSAECASQECHNGIGDLSPVKKYCSSSTMNCALPGYGGAMYGSVISVEGSLFCCSNPGSGSEARFVRWTKDPKECKKD